MMFLGCFCASCMQLRSQVYSAAIFFADASQSCRFMAVSFQQSARLKIFICNASLQLIEPARSHCSICSYYHYTDIYRLYRHSLHTSQSDTGCSSQQLTSRNEQKLPDRIQLPTPMSCVLMAPSAIAAGGGCLHIANICEKRFPWLSIHVRHGLADLGRSWQHPSIPFARLPSDALESLEKSRK